MARHTMVTRCVQCGTQRIASRDPIEEVVLARKELVEPNLVMVKEELSFCDRVCVARFLAQRGYMYGV